MPSRRSAIKIERRPAKEIQQAALVATSVQEYKKLRRDYPTRQIIFDVEYAQESLFNTRDYIDV